MNNGQVQRLFDEALLLESDERSSYLDEACAGDIHLRSEVEACLSFHENEVRCGFLRPLPIEICPIGVSDSESDPLVGGQIGPYKLLERIGTGGMSNVYLAERPGDFVQRVAIKVIKCGQNTREMMRRFRNETRFLASLSEHPNIAALYDAGVTKDGEPYLVLEYVKGQAIDLYCDEHQLDIRERLSLFRIVCDAVQYAHRHAVIHRDLKPSNILIRPDGLPKLIDFGIAKLIYPDVDEESALRTGTEFRVLTPDYASPEQVQGDSITTASDVYSLGVVLYELLTGLRPYKPSSRSAMETARIICGQSPPKPSSMVLRILSQNHGNKSPSNVPDSNVASCRLVDPGRLARSLAGDLDTIVLKALEKEPERRYLSINDFSADIGRFLRAEPINARPLGVVERGRRWFRRNPLVGGLTAVVAVFVIATAVISPIVAVRFQQQRDAIGLERTRAVIAEHHAKGEAANALRAEQRAKSEAATAEKVTDYLTALYASSDRVSGAMLRSELGAFPRHSSHEVGILAQGAEQAIARLADQPRIQAKLIHSVGTIYLGLARIDDAERLFKRSLELRRSVLEPQHVEVGISAFDLARVYLQQGKWSESKSLLLEAKSVFRSASADYRSLFGATLLLLAHLETTNDNREVPIGLYREALTEMTQHWTGNRAYLTKVIEGWSDLLMMIFTDNYPYCEVTRVQSPLIFEFLISIANYDGDEDPVALMVSIHEFYTMFILGDDDAIDAGRESLDRIRRMFGVHDKSTALATFVIAGATYRAGNREETESLLLESLAIANETLGEQHYVVAGIKYFLGDMYAEQGKLDLAEPLLRDAVAISSKTVSDVYPELVVRGMKRLASVLRETKQFAEAKQVDREADVLLAGRLWWGYQLYRSRGEMEKAQSVLQSALPLFALDYQADNNGFPVTEMFEKTLFLQQATVAYLTNDRIHLENVLQDIEKRFPNDQIVQKAAHFRHLQKPPIPSDAAAVPVQVRTVSVSELAFEAASVSLGRPLRDQVPIVGAGTCFLQVDDEFFPRGLFAAAPSKYVVRLDSKWSRFRTQYGMQNGHPGRVMFVVRGDDKEVFRSPTITDNRIRQIDIDVSETNILQLVVERIEDRDEVPWAVWVSPKLER